MLKRKKTSSTVVGLELDPSHVAAAEVAVNGSVVATNGATAELRAGVLRDGEVNDAAALTETLRAMWAEHKLPTRVRLGIANQRIVVRTLHLPPLDDEKALAAAVRVEAPDHIPMPIDEAVLDFQVLGVVDTPQGPRTRVVIVAVRREMVERFADAVRAAGLQIEGIDLSAFGMVRALSADSAGDGEGVLYVNVAGLTNVAVASGSDCLFTRAASGGMDALVHTLAERRALTAEHARQWLEHVGLETPIEDVEGDAEVVVAARAVLEEGVHQLADTIRNSLNFYRMQEGAQDVSRVVLTGPALAVPGLAARLSSELRLPLDVATVRHDDVLADRAGALTVAAGLAVEQA